MTDLSGSARFLSDDEDSCLLRYTLTSELAEHLPRWADEPYQRRPAEVVVIDFCDWIDAEWAKLGSR